MQNNLSVTTTRTYGAPLRAQPLRRELFAQLPNRYDLLAEVLSFGQNRRWRRAMVDVVVAALPGQALDVATGTAGVALQVAARSGARVTGADLSPEMLRVGAAKVSASPEAQRVTLVLARGERLPFGDATFDALSFTYLLRYVADPAATIGELARVVKPGGVVANLEFAVPRAPLWHALWLAYTRMGLPLAGLALGNREWYDVGRFLGPSIKLALPPLPPRLAREGLEQAGLQDVRTRFMSLGGGLVMWAHKGR